ncbi:MAG: hypothetical protein AAF639_20190 [Chloroflexota bacterium]
MNQKQPAFRHDAGQVLLSPKPAQSAGNHTVSPKTSPTSCHEVGRNPGDYPPLFSTYCNAASNRFASRPRLPTNHSVEFPATPSTQSSVFEEPHYRCETDACRNLVPGHQQNASTTEAWVIRTRYLEGHCAYTEEQGQDLDPNTTYIGIFTKSVIENHGSEDVFIGNPRRLSHVEWHDCHNHYHTIQNLASTMIMPEQVWADTETFVDTYFDVLIQNGLTFQEIVDGAISQSRTHHDIVLTNGKAGGCMVDSGRVDDDVETDWQYDCDYQGLTSGWFDNYTLTVTDQINIPWSLFVEMLAKQRDEGVRWVVVKLINGSGEIEECEPLSCIRDNLIASEPFELFSAAQAETILLSECDEEEEDCWREDEDYMVTMEALRNRTVQDAQLHGQEMYTTYLPVVENQPVIEQRIGGNDVGALQAQDIYTTHLPIIEHQKPVHGQSIEGTQSLHQLTPALPTTPNTQMPMSGLDAFIFGLFFMVSAAGQWWQRINKNLKIEGMKIEGMKN